MTDGEATETAPAATPERRGSAALTAPRIVVTTNAGRASRAGMDLKEAAVRDPRHPERGFAGIVRHPIDKPLITAVNGPALGGGARIALARDLIVAGENAAFVLPEVRHGLFRRRARYCGYHRIPRDTALETALTSMPVDAARASGPGLVNRVAPAAKSVDLAIDPPGQVAAGTISAARAVRHLMARGEQTTREPGRKRDRAWQEIRAGANAKDGPRTFAGKRAPRWSSR